MKQVFVILLLNLLFALPRYSIESASSCLSCHVNPSGGGMRNDYGSNVYSIDELPLKRLIKNADNMWDGYISDNLQIGGDFRIQLFDDGVDSRIFPMQSDLYANLKVSKNTEMYLKIDTSPYKKNEFFVLFKNVFDKTWIKIGQTLPIYGLKLDDHTSFIRGGNRTSLTDNSIDEGLFFDPLNITNPISIETGVSINNNIRLNMSIANGFIKSSGEEMLNSSITLNYFKKFHKFSLMSGFSIMNEKDIKSNGVFGGFSFDKLTVSFEFDEVQNWLDFYTSRAGYTQFVYKVMQGFHLIAKYDYFDRHIEYSSGDISRYSVGFEVYPLNILEIKFQVRKNEIENYLTELDLNTEYLIQVHTWF